MQKQLFTNWQHTFAKQNAPVDPLYLTLKYINKEKKKFYVQKNATDCVAHGDLTTSEYHNTLTQCMVNMCNMKSYHS